MLASTMIMLASMALPAQVSPSHLDACGALSGLVMEGGKIESSASIEPPYSVDLGDPELQPSVLRPFCRVRATLSPTPDSQIRVEVWLPLQSAWNGKLAASGNGGFAGNLIEPYAGMMRAITKGYAVAGTDTGHTQTDASWAPGHPEKVKDFGYRAEHLTAVTAKTIVQAYYGSAPKRSYFQGCSDGGREALMEARRFPNDFDGIIAAAPAANWTGLMTGFVWNTRALSGAASPSKRDFALIEAQALQHCVSHNGVVDDPLTCRPDLTKLICGAGEDPSSWVAAPKITAIKQVYRGATDPASGALLSPGLMAGAEASVNWESWIASEASQQSFFSTAFFKDMVFQTPTWTPSDFNFHRDPKLAQERLGDVLNVTGSDLSGFSAHGRKLILWQGAEDPAVPPLATVKIYESARASLGAKRADQSLRLFVVPGVGHCVGGPGPDSFDMLAALDRWVEQGVAPNRVIASHYADYIGAIKKSLQGDPAEAPAFTRPLCPYPQRARYHGGGPDTEARHYKCPVD